MITRDGIACLGDFGIAREFADTWNSRFRFKLGTARYIAPEQFGSRYSIGLASKESDIYSVAMTSFTVRSSSTGKPSDT